MSKLFKNHQRDFTLIELLVVIAILGVLAAVAIPKLSQFIGAGQTAANATEKAAIQTAVMAMLTEAKDGQLDAGVTATAGNLHLVVATRAGATTKIYLDSYMSASSFGTGALSTTLKSGIAYVFSQDGTITSP